MKTIGERIIMFDNSLTKTVGRFNMLFPECLITKFKEDSDLEIGGIVRNDTIRLLQIAEFDIEWDLQRNLNSEKNDEEITIATNDNSIDDPDWLYYFV